MAGLQFHHEHIRSQMIQEIGYAITNNMRDPRIPQCVTVMDLKLAPDSRNATVFVSVFADEKTKKGAIIALNRAAPFIQRHVASRIKMKNLPRLAFKIDNSIDRSLRIEELLQDVKDDLD